MDKQTIVSLMEEVTRKTEEFLAFEPICVDDNGEIHPLLEEILQLRDKLVTLVNQSSDTNSIFEAENNFLTANKCLGEWMNKEFLSIQMALEKRNKAKLFQVSYGNQNAHSRPLFFDDLG